MVKRSEVSPRFESLFDMNNSFDIESQGDLHLCNSYAEKIIEIMEILLFSA